MTNYMLGIGLILTISLLNNNISAQESGEMKAKRNLHDGVMTFNNGEVIRGLMQFYDDSRVALVEKDGNANFLGPLEVKQFEFVDGSQTDRRKYVSLEYKMYSYSIPKLCFFEVLKEIKGHFTILLQTERSRSQSRDANYFFNSSKSLSSGPRLLAQQVTSLLFMDETGNIKPYIEYTYQESQGLIRDRAVKYFQYINKNLLKEMTSKHYKEIVRYSKENDISLRTTAGVLRALEHYEKIVSSEIEIR
jgi:hypothetical protein